VANDGGPDRNDVLAHIWEVADRGALIAACAWCKRLNVAGTWVSAPGGALGTIDASMSLSHSICPECAAASPSNEGAKAFDKAADI
jgi:hypothetical protein